LGDLAGQDSYRERCGTMGDNRDGDRYADRRGGAAYDPGAVAAEGGLSVFTCAELYGPRSAADHAADGAGDHRYVSGTGEGAGRYLCSVGDRRWAVVAELFVPADAVSDRGIRRGDRDGGDTGAFAAGVREQHCKIS